MGQLKLTVHLWTWGAGNNEGADRRQQYHHANSSPVQVGALTDLVTVYPAMVLIIL